MPRLYHSGTPANHRFQGIENGLCKYRLFSLHGSYQAAVMRWLDDVKAGETNQGGIPTHIMLDSGAFTAWNKGEATTVEHVIDAYARFIDHAGELFEAIWMINLDVIPGQAGRDPTPQEIADAIKQSDINFEILNKRFPYQVLPVFHQGEHLSRLKEVQKQAQYVCLSPRNDLHESARLEWGRALHSRFPGIKSHGLAATGIDMFKAVPWYSVDSAAWRLRAAYGMVIVNVGTAYRSIFFSHEGGKQKDWGTHYDSLPQVMRDFLTARIESYGFTLEQVKVDAIARAVVSMGELSAFVDGVPEIKKMPRPTSIFEEEL